MREILFRGKQKDTGEWVQGDLHHNDDTRFPMTLIGHVVMSRDKYIQQDLNFDGYDLCEVEPETVGEYSGERDKHGKLIFEGDIVQHMVNGKLLRGKVEYADGAFGVRIITGGAQFLCFFVDDTCEVIGNVHDNPELMEVK